MRVVKLWCLDWTDFLIFIIMVVVTFEGLRAQESICCSHTTGSCRTMCEKISLVQLAAHVDLRKETVTEVQKYCSFQLHEFWQCLNATFKDMTKGDSWSGRICCPLPNSDSCRKACTTAASVYDLTAGCRKSDEISFYNCLDRQRDGEECCSNARTLDCKASCIEIFRSQVTPTKHQREKIKANCEVESPMVLDCIKDIIRVTHVKNMHKHMYCCDKSNNSKCRAVCKQVLSTKDTLQEIIDSLIIGGCGQVLPQEIFWSCIFQSLTAPDAPTVEVSRIERVGMDSAKWHCCQRANSSHCARLCSKTFAKSWATTYATFDRDCLNNNTNEKHLMNCIEEVEEPCELGCDGLSFCTNFNNRPTELFKSCTSQADDAARNEVTKWQNQDNITIGDLVLPLKSISNYAPNLWKTVACTLQIKPCSRYSYTTQICRDICIEMVTEYLDWTRIPLDHTPETICEQLSPSEDPNSSCVNLQNYLTPRRNDYPRISRQVLSPCKDNPCEPHEICLINRNCLHGMNCLPYTCKPGCKLGEVSHYMVPDGTYVRIPDNFKGFLKICKCTKHKIEKCQPLPRLVLSPCDLGVNERPHGAIFELDCNKCSCYAGETVCSKRQCETTSLTGRNTAFTTLPCNCPPHYVPVCGRNGVTYPSACLAKCSDLSDADIDLLPCQNPCNPNTCPIGKKCVPKPQICLSLMHKPCKQYECVTGSTNCAFLPKDPVCDIENQEYENSCLLAHHNGKLAYRGPCLHRCRFKGQVCGINGKTYISECAAFADMVAADYDGPCVAIGLITNSKTNQCAAVNCPKLQNPNCLGITPPGACCPICGGSLRILFSRKQVDRALYALQNHSSESVNLKSVLKGLERQVQVAQCNLRGYVTVELEIFVIIQSTERYPTDLQEEACVIEAEKIAGLINMQRPRIASELSLSSLTAATIVHTNVSGSISWLHGSTIWGHCLFILGILFLSRKFR